MASSANEIIRLRNEGAVAYEKLIQDFGYEKARKMLAERVGAKCNIAITAEEHSRAIELVKDAVTNTYLALVYTTLHDICGYGKKRLQRFKQAFDSTAVICFTTDARGKRYATVADCAEEMNRLYNMGLDLQVVEDTETHVDAVKNRMCSAASVIGYLKEHGQKDAANMILQDVYGQRNEKERARTKEQRAIAKRRRHEDRKYKDPAMNLFDPEVSAGYLALMTKVLIDAGMNDDQIVDACGKLNEMLTNVLEYGRDYLDGITRDLEETHGFAFE